VREIQAFLELSVYMEEVKKKKDKFKTTRNCKEGSGEEEK
jgi:hypothetical protein